MKLTPLVGDIVEFSDTDKYILDIKERKNELSLIEVKCSIGAREDLGRPTTTALKNKQIFMSFLQTEQR